MFRFKTQVIVVGNGHLTSSDRGIIQRLWQAESHDVVRFNDMNSWRSDEPITVHAYRTSGSFLPFQSFQAREWRVTHTLAALSAAERAAMARNDTSHFLLPILIYEPSKGAENDLTTDARVFADCTQCECRQNASAMGPSTGAAVIDALSGIQHVERIEVFGMNWASTVAHIDFVDKTMVTRCCTKCVIHATPDDAYGDEWGTPHAVQAWGAGLLFFLLCSLCAARHFRARRRHRALAEDDDKAAAGISI